jgi:cell shape-determining protein MreD
MNYQNLFKRINEVGFLIIALILAVFQTTIFKLSLFHWFHPDFAFILILYLSYKKELVEGAVLSFIITLIFESMSANPPYLYVLIYLYIFVAAKILTKTYVIKSFASATGVILSLFLLKEILLFLMMVIKNKFINSFPQYLIHIVPLLITQIFLTPICFKIFQKYDFLTLVENGNDDSKTWLS